MRSIKRDRGRRRAGAIAGRLVAWRLRAAPSAPARACHAVCFPGALPAQAVRFSRTGRRLTQDSQPTSGAAERALVRMSRARAQTACHARAVTAGARCKRHATSLPAIAPARLRPLSRPLRADSAGKSLSRSQRSRTLHLMGKNFVARKVICRQCSRAFRGYTNSARYCSDCCRQRHHRRKIGRGNCTPMRPW